jgi:hypothetical protein
MARDVDGVGCWVLGDGWSVRGWCCCVRDRDGQSATRPIRAGAGSLTGPRPELGRSSEERGKSEELESRKERASEGG